MRPLWSQASRHWRTGAEHTPVFRRCTTAVAAAVAAAAFAPGTEPAVAGPAIVLHFDQREPSAVIVASQTVGASVLVHSGGFHFPCRPPGAEGEANSASCLLLVPSALLRRLEPFGSPHWLPVA